MRWRCMHAPPQAATLTLLARDNRPLIRMGARIAVDCLPTKKRIALQRMHGERRGGPSWKKPFASARGGSLRS